MSQVKQVSKRKRLTKAAGVPALGAAGLGLSLVGSGSGSALATAELPQSLNTTPNQRFVLNEEEIADVSLATFHVFDKENSTRGFTQVAMGCGGCGGCGCGGCGGSGEDSESSGSSGSSGHSGHSGGCRGGGGRGYGGCCASWGGCRRC
jgi:hypothetical protein